MQALRIVFLWLFFLSSNAFLYAQNLELEVQRAPYQFLSEIGDPILINDAYFTKDTAWELDLPFAIKLNEKTYSKMWISSRGRLCTSNPKEGYPFDVISIFESNFQASLAENPKSTLSYLIMNDAPERILVIEWRGYYFQEFEGVFDSLNMQLWIYEKGGKYEFHYGPHDVELIYSDYRTFGNGHFGGISGIGTVNNKNEYEGYWFYGDSLSPQIINVIKDDAKVGNYRIGFAPDSTVYVITPEKTTGSGVHSEESDIRMMKEEGTRYIMEISTADLLPAQYYLYELNGRIVQSGKLTHLHTALELSGLAKGIYQITLSLPGHRLWTQRFFLSE